MGIIVTSVIKFLTESFEFFVPAVLILLIAFILHSIIKIQIKRTIARNLKKESRQVRRLQKTRVEFLGVFIVNIIYLATIISILFLIPGFKTFSVSLLAGAGILAIIIGFAAQKTLANIIAGISIVVYTPFRIGDRVKIGENLGDVEEITLRHTVVRTWDNRRIFFPNSIIAEKEIVNYSIKEEMILSTLDMGISYDADIDKAKNIMVEEANRHPDIIRPMIKDEDGNIEEKIPVVRLTECKDFSVNLKLYFWVDKPGKAYPTAFDLTESIKKRIDKEGIEIPFPYRTIVFKKDLDESAKKN